MNGKITKALCLAVAFALVLTLQAQKKPAPGQAFSDAAISIPSGKSEKWFTAPPEQVNLTKSAGLNRTTFNLSYLNATEDAKRAAEYAAGIWESLVNTTVPVNIVIRMETLDEDILAMSRPSTFFMNFDGTPVRNVYYSVALAEKLSGEELNPGNPDIVCSFNQNLLWYFGTDGNTPVEKYDFVTAVLHEIAHGLGFSGFYKDDGSVGFFNNGSNLPAIYDWYVFNSKNQQLADKNLFHRPSVELHRQLTSGKLQFVQEESETLRVSEIYAPPVWNDGASIYHLTGGNGLMEPFAVKGRAIHNPGDEVMSILSEIGWEAVTFDFNVLKDFENPVAELPFEVGIVSERNLEDPVVYLVFSTDNFQTSDSLQLQANHSSNRFAGKIPLDYYIGKLQYYIKLEASKKVYYLPSMAPEKKFTIRIGPDYQPPLIAHNPEKIITVAEPELQISAVATDNIGIRTVKMEYRLNGVDQEPVFLKESGNDRFTIQLDFTNENLKNTTIEYRLIAKDEAASENKRTSPSSGFYRVNVFCPEKPVTSYSTDFENGPGDFVTADFSISKVAGFYNTILHTRSPYPVSAREDEKYNLAALLKYPVILEQDGLMLFDEVVLVEPGEPGADYNCSYFWDYVIVEGSKDCGKTWLPFTSGYDSGADELWKSSFLNSLVNSNSQAVGNQSMFLRNRINLTENNNFSAGDTVIFRFRLASDNAVNGWGWAIDNLEIQKSFSTGSDVVAQSGFNVYPNPFKNRFYIDYNTENAFSQIEITVTDIFGKTVYRQTGIDTFHTSKIQVELPNVSKGIYLLTVAEENRTVYSRKLVKN